MDRGVSPSWSQFFSQLSLPPECVESYSLSFTQNSLQLSMIPDLLPDYMGHLGISKLGHLMMIKKRARELLYPSKERGTTDASDTSDVEPPSKRHPGGTLTRDSQSPAALATTRGRMNSKRAKRKSTKHSRGPAVPSPQIPQIQNNLSEDPFSPPPTHHTEKRVLPKRKRKAPSNKPSKLSKRKLGNIVQFLTEIQAPTVLTHPNVSDSTERQAVVNSVRTPGELSVLSNSPLSPASEVQSPNADIIHIPSSQLVPHQEKSTSLSVQESYTEINSTEEIPVSTGASPNADKSAGEVAKKPNSSTKNKAQLIPNKKRAQTNSLSTIRKLKKAEAKPKLRRVRIGVKKDTRIGPLMVKPVLTDKVKLPLITNKRFNRPLPEPPFETRGRSTSPEADDSEVERNLRRLRIISTVKKRYSNFYTTIYPEIQPQEAVLKLPLRGNSNHARPQQGARLSLKDTLIFARQERRTFTCHECSQCFETPYQLLRHSMLTRCDEIDSPYPEY